jgi:nickel-dependent lactate racemase
MRIELAYGAQGLAVDLPDDAVVLRPQERPGVPDETEAIRQALRAPIDAPPLTALLRPESRVTVVFSDITRPMPNDRVLPILLAELERVVSARQITLLNALGTHRPNTAAELEAMLGADVVARYAIAQHDAWDGDNLVSLGHSPQGRNIAVNRAFYESDVKILTGFIEPHLFAGFSGGPKAVLPGVASLEAIMDNHGYALLRDPRATWGVTVGNPVWEEMAAAAELARPDFLLNVTLNRQRAITGVYAGELFAAHAQGVAAARDQAMVPVAAPFDVVVTTNSGYPLDINLYQAVKGMSCVAGIVKQGGTIVIAAECRDGVPDHGEYRRLVREGGSVAGILRLVGQPGFRCQDQWEAQLQAQVQQQVEVLVHSDYLPDATLREMLFQPCHDIAAAVAEALQRHGPGARLCVLPEGPQTIPYIR